MVAQKARVWRPGDIASPARVNRHPDIPFEGEKRMKRLATLVFALLVGASLSFAQAATGTPAKTDTKTTETGKKATKTKSKGKKGGKKGKKSSGGTTTPAPK
jgi:hypothetical protein